MTRALLCSGCLCLLLVGCVPYQVHKQTRDELGRAKLAVEDLTKKYNQAMNRLLAYERGGAVNDPAMKAKLARLTQERDDLAKKLRAREFLPSEIPDGPGVRVGPYGGIVLGEAALFAEGSASLASQARGPLSQIASLLNGPGYRKDRILIEGHTDDQELKITKGRWGTNMNLGFQRAYAVYNYFLSHGVDEERMEIGSFAYLRPTPREGKALKEWRQQNRRVVVRRIGADL